MRLTIGCSERNALPLLPMSYGPHCAPLILLSRTRLHAQDTKNDVHARPS